MKHTLSVTAAAEVGADMMARDCPTPDVRWHQRPLSNRLVAFGEAQPCCMCQCQSSGCTLIPSHHLLNVRRELI